MSGQPSELSTWPIGIVPLLGLWVIASAFILNGSIRTGIVHWSNIIVGALIVVLGGYGIAVQLIE